MTYQEKLEETLISALETGFVVFFYRKVNGEKRAAVGTSNIELIKKISNWRPKGNSDNNRSGAYAYYDLVDEDWRSFRRGNLIDIAVDTWGCPVMEKRRYITNIQTAIRMAIKYAAERSDTERMESLVDLLMSGQTSVQCDKLVADKIVEEDILNASKEVNRPASEIMDDINSAAEEIISLVNEYTRRLNKY